MRSKSSILAVLVGVALAVGCGDKDKEETAADDQEEPTEPEEDNPEPEEPDEPEEPAMANQMANCPNAVEGASTELGGEEGVVVMTVTAEDEEAVAEIRKRASHLAEVDEAGGDKVEHTGKGTGGGGLGKCPVVMQDTSLEVEEVEGGAKITLKPADEAQLAALQGEVKSRHDAMESGDGHEGHGHGSGTGGGGGGGGGGE